MLNHFRVYWLTCVVILVVASASMATTIVMPTDTQLIDKSPVIVKGTVLRSQAVQRNGGIWTETTLAVSDVLKGEVGSEVTIREIGGRVGDRFTVIFGAPRYSEGEQVLAFLIPTPRGDFQTTDLFVGKFSAGTTRTGVRTWLRDDATDNTTVLDHSFQPITASGAQRNAELFEQYIADRVAGRPLQPNYNIAGSSSLLSGTDSLQTSPNFTVISEPDIYRWTSFDSGTSASWYSIGTQTGYVGGGVSEVQTAMGVWTGYAAAKILYSYAGVSTAAPGGNNRMNGLNEIDFEDPTADIAGSWNPATGGVVGLGGFSGVAASPTTWVAPFAADASHPAGAHQAWTITEGNLVIQDGVSPSAGIPSFTLAEIVAHEFGHTLGFGHSTDSTALMYPSVTGLGASLRADDQLAARWLYPSGTSTPPPTSSVPNAPSNLSAAVSGVNVLLAWSDNATNETSYSVYVAAGSGAFSNAGSLGANATSATVSGLTAGTWHFYVVAVNASGQSAASNTATATLTTSSPTPPTAMFSLSPNSGTAGLTSFTLVDQSTGSVFSRLWTLGDGSSSIAASLSHVYAFAGIYTITLTVQNSVGQSSSTSQTVTVNAAAPSLSAAFTYMPSSPVTGQTVSFLDQSTGGVNSWLWSFGDGSSSSVQNPTKQYAAPGSYTVTLTAFAGSTSASTTRVLVVTASSPASPTVAADFSYPATPVAVGTAIPFTDKSTGSPTTWTWSFGDGSTSSAHNPTHTYTSAGTFTVTLNASNGQNSGTSTHQVVVARPRHRAADK
jgi:PKD repeat protein